MDENKNTIAEPANVPEPKQKIHTFKYWADVVKWFINLIGELVDYIKNNPFPKKEDYAK